MPINLKVPNKKNMLPAETPFQSPKENFLSGLQGNQAEMQSKIAQISGQNNGTSPAQEINETNWQSFQGTDPSQSNYQPQSLIDYNRTGQASSEIATPTGTANPLTQKTDTLAGKTFNWLAKPETAPALGSFKPTDITTPLSEDLGSLSNTLSQGAIDLKNKAYGDGSDDNRKAFIGEMLDKGFDQEAIIQAMETLDKEGVFQGSLGDNPLTGSLASIAAGFLQMGSLAAKSGSDFSSMPQIAAEGVQEGKSGGDILGDVAARGAKATMEGGMAGLGLATSFTPAGIAVNTAFSTDTVAEPMDKYLAAPVREGVAAGQEALGFDSNSQASQDIQETGGMVGPLAILGGAHAGARKGSQIAKPYIDSALSGAKSKFTAPKTPKTPIEPNKGITNEGESFTLDEKPGVVANTKDYVFGTKDNVELANRSVFPNMTKEKGVQAKLNSGKVALDGVTQLHNDVRTGKIEGDISTMRGGAEAIENGRDYWGKEIGKLTKNDAVFDISELSTKLGKSLDDPYTEINADIRNLGLRISKIIDATDGSITVEKAQKVLSNIKSEIFNNAETVKKLYGTDAGIALREFLDGFSAKFDEAIEKSTGNSPELIKAKASYAKYAKIERDFMRSLMASERNSRTGALGKAGSVVGLYELLRNPSLSGIATSIITKTVLNEMGHVKSRGGAYENLIRNLDRVSLDRSKGKFISGDKSLLKLPKNAPNNRNSSNSNSSVATKRSLGVKIPIKEIKNEQKLLPAPRGLLPVPKVPKGTDYARTDPSAESMREATKAKRPTSEESKKDLTSSTKSNIIDTPSKATMKNYKQLETDRDSVIYENLANEAKTKSMESFINENKAIITNNDLGGRGVKDIQIGNSKLTYRYDGKGSSPGSVITSLKIDNFNEGIKLVTKAEEIARSHEIWNTIIYTEDKIAIEVLKKLGYKEIVNNFSKKVSFQNSEPLGMFKESPFSESKLRELYKKQAEPKDFGLKESLKKDEEDIMQSFKNEAKNSSKEEFIKNNTIIESKKITQGSTLELNGSKIDAIHSKEGGYWEMEIEKIEGSSYEDLVKLLLKIDEYVYQKEDTYAKVYQKVKSGSIEEQALQDMLYEKDANGYYQKKESGLMSVDSFSFSKNKVSSFWSQQNGVQSKSNIIDTPKSKAMKDKSNSQADSLIKENILTKAKRPTEKYRTAEDLNNTQLTTKILKGLGDRETVSKEFIRNMTNSGDVKQVEKDIIRGLLESEGDKVNVADFKKKVQAELLPLKVKYGAMDPKVTWKSEGAYTPKFETVTLPREARGNVKNYRENIYESPIETSAGNVHFSGYSKNYFGHTRIEDMADNSTRRVIEVQSDLFQRGRLENDALRIKLEKDIKDKKADIKFFEDKLEKNKGTDLEQPYRNELLKLKNESNKLEQEIKDWNKLSQYNDPTAHFRMIREEVSKAVEDGKTKLQFPTGDTAMKIEGLGRTETFVRRFGDDVLTPENMKISDEVIRWGEYWVITDILGDGKFKAIPKKVLDIDATLSKEIKIKGERGSQEYYDDANSRYGETFDISGKVDQNNPIFKFYEKEVGRYLKNKYNAKLVTDDKGVSWYQVDLKESMGGPVEAFRKGETIKSTPLTSSQKAKLQDLNERFFGDKNLQIVDKIVSNEKALGSYKDGMIKIVDGQGKPTDTFHHEAVHKYLDIFASKDEAKAILEYGKTKYKESDYASVEEMIAEDFIKFAKDRTGITGKMKIIFEDILNRIRTYFGKGDSIDQMYRDILQGKAKSGKILKIPQKVGN